MADLDFDELDQKIKNHTGSSEEQVARKAVKEALVDVSKNDKPNTKPNKVAESSLGDNNFSVPVNINKDSPSTSSKSVTTTDEADKTVSISVGVNEPLSKSNRAKKPSNEPVPRKIEINSGPSRDKVRPVGIQGVVQSPRAGYEKVSQVPGPSSTSSAIHMMDELNLDELTPADNPDSGSGRVRQDLIGQRDISQSAPVRTVRSNNLSASNTSPKEKTETYKDMVDSREQPNIKNKRFGFWDIIYYLLVAILVIVIISLILILLDRYDIITLPEWAPLV